MVREGESQREPCPNHSHPRVTTGILKTALPEGENPKLNTAGEGGVGREATLTKINRPDTKQINRQKTVTNQEGRGGPESRVATWSILDSLVSSNNKSYDTWKETGAYDLPRVHWGKSRQQKLPVIATRCQICKKKTSKLPHKEL